MNEMSKPAPLGFTEHQPAGEVWAAPDLSLIRQEAVSAPPLPAGVLPVRWAEWVKDAAEGAGAPPAFIACAMLSAAGAVIGNSRWASPWPSWREPPALNVALIGKPSSGKSPALDQVVALLTRLEADLNEDFQDRRRESVRTGKEYAEKMRLYDLEVKEAVSRGTPPPLPPLGDDAAKPPQRRRIYSTESTTEKAARLAEANPRGLLLQRDELAGWIASMDRYSGGAGGDRPFWLQAYGGRAWAPDRIKDDNPIFVPHLLWAVLGTIQPDRVSTLMMAGDDDGLTARFLYCWPEPLPPRRPARHADNEAAFHRLARLRALAWDDAPEPKVMPLTERAVDALQEWRLQVAEMEDSTAGLMLSWLGKLPGMALRLALILELLAWSEAEGGTAEPEAISERSLVAAVTFLEGFALPMARRTFGAAALPEAERDARRLARWLVRQPTMPEIVNAKELRRMAQGPAIPDAERMEAALRELEAAQWVREAPSRAGGKGRQRKDWAVNPGIRDALP
ncbi:DUF3987 domain-containing protein [Acidocella facilis]|uniref:DUF3987 domain-containing protein n=1 Tax=Acidocella facilis TaxID=525 RepID=UPI001F341C93|nr:DUF3987 domain-containing protein [Acidocella facilis]